MSDGVPGEGTGENNTIFAFGTVQGPALGQMVLSGGRVLGYENPRERCYRIDGRRLELLDDAARVTAVLERLDGERIAYVGRSTDSATLLHLTGLFTFDHPTVTARPPAKVLVNTVPKSGTYWLRKAFVSEGYLPTDLHLGVASVHDNRLLGDDADIHWRPLDSEVQFDVGLLPLILPSGSVSVGHIEDPALLRRMIAAGMSVVNVTRDFEAVLGSLFTFKRDKVEPLPGEVWRDAPDLTSQVLGFAAAYGGRDIAHVRAIRAMMADMEDMPVLRYEDLERDHIPAHQRRRLAAALRSRRGARGIIAAIGRTRGTATSTLTVDEREDGLLTLIHQLAVGVEG